MNNNVKPLLFIKNTAPVKISPFCSIGNQKKFNFLLAALIITVGDKRVYSIKTGLYPSRPSDEPIDDELGNFTFESAHFDIDKKEEALLFMKAFLLAFDCREFDVFYFDKQEIEPAALENFVARWIKQTPNSSLK